MSIDNFFKNLDILENWYKEDIVTLAQYYEIKSNLVTQFQKQSNMNSYNDNDCLPF